MSVHNEILVRTKFKFCPYNNKCFQTSAVSWSADWHFNFVHTVNSKFGQ